VFVAPSQPPLQFGTVDPPGAQHLVEIGDSASNICSGSQVQTQSPRAGDPDPCQSSQSALVRQARLTRMPRIGPKRCPSSTTNSTGSPVRASSTPKVVAADVPVSTASAGAISAAPSHRRRWVTRSPAGRYTSRNSRCTPGPRSCSLVTTPAATASVPRNTPARSGSRTRRPIGASINPAPTTPPHPTPHTPDLSTSPPTIPTPSTTPLTVSPFPLPAFSGLSGVTAAPITPLSPLNAEGKGEGLVGDG